ncbi:acyltransferase [Paractinoplanes rishiriensis]|uniref:Acyltransferase n=1 Tax=Paractinoplanes rishiriensis TaxID=1050105 RepID=A0A919MSF2_9ACTN|nr:acyltransferase [Actinoplanes rishiriensis]
MLPAERGFRTDIEGLRAIAVLLVVAGHAGVPGLAGGYVGVDVFFVISGFLITSLLLREAEQAGRISVARFYARRAVRLLPAAAVVLLATLAAARLFLPATRLGEYVRDALAATGYVANLRFAVIGTDYLSADQPPSPFQHFWSLAVEEQFYLVWPLLIVAAAYLGKRRRPLAAVLAVLVAGSFVLSVTETVRSQPWAYFGPHTRAWELGAGALLALAAVRLRRLPAAARFALGWAGVAAILLAAVRYDESTAFPGWRAALPVAGAVALIAAGGAGAGKLLAVRPLQAVGRLSYSWYLWHWPLLLIGPAALGVRGTLPQKVLLAAAALGLAWATHRWVENPLRHRPHLRDRAARGLGLGAALSGSVAAAGVALLLLPHGVPAGERRPDLRATLSAAADPAAELTRHIEAGRRLGRLPANLRPKLAAAGKNRPRVWADGCHADVPATAAPAGCVYGDPAGDTTVVLFGDSHAAHWFPALEQIAVSHRWRLVELTKSSCSAADVPLWHDSLKRTYTECTAFHRSAIARIQALKPDLVVIGSSFNYTPARPAGDPAALWRSAWDRTFDQVRRSGARVAAIADTPYMGGSVPECLAKPDNAAKAGNCTRSRRSALRGLDQREVFLSYAGGRRAEIINPLAWFCTDVCPPVIGNVLVYRDSNHMTTAYAEALVPLLAARLSAADQPG